MTEIRHSQLAPLPRQVPFRLVSRTIGSGAYACIKRAAPVAADNPVFAVKFINKAYALKYGRIKKKQIDLEVTLHKYIGVHRNVVEFYETGEDANWVWIAMELAEGGDLFDKVEADAGLSEDIAHAYFKQLIHAVEYMHSKGVAHRDLKPENVLLDADGNLKLADFGMAALFQYNGQRKVAQSLCGSPPYVAPEVLQCGHSDKAKGKGYDADRADIWSCGVVLFVLLAGNTPWDKPIEGRDEYGRPNEYSEYLRSNGRPDDELWHGLPTEVLSLLRGMMRVDASARFSLQDVRRHPWYRRKNSHIDKLGQFLDPLTTATSMFESLKVSFDADPFRGSQKTAGGDLMEIDTPEARPLAISSTQPTTPAEDMLFDWEKFRDLAISSTQPSRANLHAGATQSVELSTFLAEEPSMSQFASKPAVSLTRTQMARRFGDILPPQRLTKFYSSWSPNHLVPHLLEACSQLNVPTAPTARPEPSDRESVIKIVAQDGRGCPLTGRIVVELVEAALVEVSFHKGSGDPLEWRRLFKKVAVLCRDALYRQDE